MIIPQKDWSVGKLPRIRERYTTPLIYIYSNMEPLLVVAIGHINMTTKLGHTVFCREIPRGKMKKNQCQLFPMYTIFGLQRNKPMFCHFKASPDVSLVSDTVLGCYLLWYIFGYCCIFLTIWAWYLTNFKNFRLVWWHFLEAYQK